MLHTLAYILDEDAVVGILGLISTEMAEPALLHGCSCQANHCLCRMRAARLAVQAPALQRAQASFRRIPLMSVNAG